MDFYIREIQPKDNAAIEKIIRDCLIEFNAAHEGTAWADPDLGRFSEIYNSEENKYWVAANNNDKIIAGAGIGRLNAAGNICELQKMYCLPEARGKGVSDKLMETALAHAKKFYDKCYLETLENMTAAQRFYEKYGFVRIYEPIGCTGHFECDVRYIKEL